MSLLLVYSLSTFAGVAVIVDADLDKWRPSYLSLCCSFVFVSMLMMVLTALLSSLLP